MSSDSTQQQLQQAYEHIRSGRKSEAAALLMPILKADEDNANAWWLMANAVTDPADIREALENVLRLRPGDAKAQKMLADLAGRAPADEFPLGGPVMSTSSSDVPDWLADKPKRGGQQGQKSGTSPLVIILAVLGVVALIACGICALITGGAISIGGQVISEIMTEMPEGFMLTITAISPEDIEQLMTAMPGGFSLNTGDLVQRGTIEYGQTVKQTVDTFDDDGWTFTGSAGDRVTMEVNAAEPGLDPEVSLYDSSNTQLGYNDDRETNTLNSQLIITLPSNGIYTIRVSAIGAGGDYELILRRG